jgi:hypothetical protein
MIQYYSAFASFWPVKNLAEPTDGSFCASNAKDRWVQHAASPEGIYKHASSSKCYGSR